MNLTKPSKTFTVPSLPLMTNVSAALLDLSPHARDYFSATELCGALKIFSWKEEDEVFTVMSLLAPTPKVLKGLLKYRLEYLRVFGEATTIKRLMISFIQNPLTFENIKTATPSSDETLMDSDGKLYISFTLDKRQWYYLMPHPLQK